MTLESLQQLSNENLFELARREGIKNPEETAKDELAGMLLDILEEKREERRDMNNLAMRIKCKKYDIVMEDEVISQIREDYPLPDRYAETRIVLMLRDPSWAFSYWDIGQADYEKLLTLENGGELFLRVYSLPAGDVNKKSFSDFFDIPLRPDDESWYINLPMSGIRYCIDLMLKEYARDVTLCRSSIISAPRSDVAGELNRAKTPFMDALYLSGLFSPAENQDPGENPRRIMSLLDSQHLHLTN